MTNTTTTTRKLSAAVVTVAIAMTVLGGAQPAAASTPHGTAVCASEMVNIQVPVAGQSQTYLRIFFWNGAEWQKWTEGTFAGPIVSGTTVVNHASGWYWVPAGRYIHVQMYGYYASNGWVKYSVGHGQQFGSRTSSFCQA